MGTPEPAMITARRGRVCLVALVLILVAAASLLALRPDGKLPQFKTEDYQAQQLRTEELPYHSTVPLHLDDPDRPVDADGVQSYERDGQRHYHPVGMAQYGLAALNGYRLTAQHEYLRRAKANAQKLLDEAVLQDRALFFPYTFDFPLLGDDNDVITAPWYSAMAQGQALSLFVRLYETTGDEHWLDAANDTFASFVQPRRDGGIWTVFVDDGGYLWLEEYAGNTSPLKVLNGHIFAIYGLYDYLRATEDDRTELLFDGAVTTVRWYVDDFRVPAGISYYCLRVRTPAAQNEKYHAIHTNQLRMLWRMTDDYFFAAMAELFASDHQA